MICIMWMTDLTVEWSPIRTIVIVFLGGLLRPSRRRLAAEPSSCCCKGMIVEGTMAMSTLGGVRTYYCSRPSTPSRDLKKKKLFAVRPCTEFFVILKSRVHDVRWWGVRVNLVLD
jgi:hypothetical protein